MRFGGILLAAALVLGGCTGDPAPREPTKTTSSPHASSTLTPPVMPKQAKEDSPEGAAAFVTHWVNVLNYAAATGDVEELSRLSSPDCEGCQRYIDLYRETYEAGGYVRGGTWRLGKLKIKGETLEVVIRSSVEVAKSEFKPSAEDELRASEGERTTVGFSLPSRGAWRLEQLFLEQQR